MTPEAVAVGSPFYDDETQSLYFVDFSGTLLFRYKWGQNTVQTLTIDGLTEPSYFIPLNGSSDQYVVSAGGSAYVVNWDGSSDRGSVERKLFTISPDLIMDSGYTTEYGELFTGTITSDHCKGTPTHGFYRYTREYGLEQIADHFTGTTGVAIIDNTLLHMDGCLQLLTAWDIDPVTRALSMTRFQ